MSKRERQYLNDTHRQNSQACLKEVAYWLEHPLSHEEAREMFLHQGDELKALRKKQQKESQL